MDSRTAFSDSNDISNGSSICCVAGNTSISAVSPVVAEAAVSDPDIAALRRLSDNLDSIFESNESNFYADARIIVDGGREVAVHRCILAARSAYFRAEFGSRKERDGGVVKFAVKDLAKDYEVGFDALVAVLGYLYSGKVRELPRGVCACMDEECKHIDCRPTVDFLVEVLYLSFTFQISELLALYQRHLLEILESVSPDDILVILRVANMCANACRRLLERCIDIIVKSDVDYIALEKSLPSDILKQIIDSRKEFGLLGPENSAMPDKHTKRIHRALDSDDVELVGMLLKEGHTTLDDAFALHYAVAYCDAKTTTELLDMGLADVNLRNRRGYTVLHVAAMRKEPNIIVSLLTKGARPTDVTSNGRKALQIAKRLTKAADCCVSPEEGKASPKDRLCIEILDQAERRDPSLGEASVSLDMAGDDLRMNLLYLENRVALAKLLYPMEAKVAMDIAQVDGTSETLLSDARRNAVDLNEAPFKEERVQRMKALSKTVELGKRFFPRCSNVLNNIMDTDELTELAYKGNDTPEERQMKKRRYMELQELLTKAFTEDKQNFDRSNLSSSSSSSPLVRHHGKLNFKR